MSTHRILLNALILALPFGLISCSLLKNVGGTLSNLSRCKFKVDSVTEFSLVGIDLSGKQKVTLGDGLKLLPAFTDKRFPAAFTVNIAAMNPNDGSGGTPATTATLRSLAWTLLIDSVQTISGNLSGPISIPGTGQSTVIPIRMDLDLYKFFSQRGYQGLINLAFALGGVNRSASHVQLRARPTVDTPLGPISTPGDIMIVDSEFRSN
ncbi:MAG: hypothetical protein WB699_15830 [Bacteroidota bacterium]